MLEVGVDQKLGHRVGLDVHSQSPAKLFDDGQTRIPHGQVQDSTDELQRNHLESGAERPRDSSQRSGARRPQCLLARGVDTVLGGEDLGDPVGRESPLDEDGAQPAPTRPLRGERFLKLVGCHQSMLQQQLANSGRTFKHSPASTVPEPGLRQKMLLTQGSRKSMQGISPDVPLPKNVLIRNTFPFTQVSNGVNLTGFWDCMNSVG
jgi:hypothetical protein